MADPVQVRRVSSLFTILPALLLIGGFLFLALLTGQRDLALLCLLVLIMATGLKCWTKAAPSRLRHALWVSQQRVFPDNAVTITAEIRNDKLLPAWVELNVPLGGLSPSTGQGMGGVHAEGNLLWHQEARYEWPVTARHRGVFDVGPMRLAAGDSLGFFQKATEAAGLLPIIVYPRLLTLPAFPLPKRDFFGIPGGESPVDDPVYILGTTDYHHGRPARYIHWKATARHHRLQEKVFDSTEQEKVLILMGVERFEEAGAEEAFEKSLEVAASLAVLLDRQGSGVGFVTNGLMAKGMPPFVPVGRGPRQVMEVLDTLAGLQMKKARTSVEMVRSMPALPWGTTCIYISFDDGDGAAIKEHLRRRKAPVVTLTYEHIRMLRGEKPTSREQSELRPEAPGWV
ncbi:MAG: DUF58 domain-containing protein [Chitinivibrionia bacterium]|nr:DUF58 domain-containing protein [Chitinivibrionia bacterium]